MNPFGAVPLVMSASGHLPEQERLRQIRRACVYTFFLMAGFLVAGGLIMNFFGISLPGMRIAGGLIVGVPRLPDAVSEPDFGQGGDDQGGRRKVRHRLHAAGDARAQRARNLRGRDEPVVAGGSAAKAVCSIVDFMGVLTAIFLTALLSWFVLRGAERVNRLLGATGMVALTRLTGFLMISIGVQFLINGITMILNDPAFWHGLAEAIRAR